MSINESRPTLDVQDLHVAYTVRGVPRPVLRGVSFTVQAGEVFGLVGESGCGKSTTAFAALRYLPLTVRSPRVACSSTVTTSRRCPQPNCDASGPERVDGVPGARFGVEPDSAHRQADHRDVRRTRASQRRRPRPVRLQRCARCRSPTRPWFMARYPHQLSGGMLQRVVIAMALACDPKLLVLDEPTTGLDATVEAEVLDLVRTLRTETGAAILMIAHNLGVIRSMCDRVGVMYAGKIVEEGPSERCSTPKHPYTVGLLHSIPRSGMRKSEHALSLFPGTLPAIGADLPTCVFVDRCPLVTMSADEVPPELRRCRWRPPGPLSPPRPDRRDGKDPRADRRRFVHRQRDPFHSRRVEDLQAEGPEDPCPRRYRPDARRRRDPGSRSASRARESRRWRRRSSASMPPTTVPSCRLIEHELAGTIAKRSTGDKRAMQIVFQNPDSALNAVVDGAAASWPGRCASSPAWAVTTPTRRSPRSPTISGCHSATST